MDGLNEKLFERDFCQNGGSKKLVMMLIVVLLAFVLFIVPPLFLDGQTRNPIIICFQEMGVIHDICQLEESLRIGSTSDLKRSLLDKIDAGQFFEAFKRTPEGSLPWCDPWGHCYLYRHRGSRAHAKDFIVWSLGPNGINEYGRGDDVILPFPDWGGWIEDEYRHTQLFVR